MPRGAQFVAVACAAFAVAGAAAEANLEHSDSALLKHIKTTNPVFSEVLGECHEEKLRRSTKNGLKYFEYKAFCAVKKEHEGECQDYKVHATGTVDNSEWATVRDIRLVLLCAKEGD
jgi:hypothetical protein